MATTHQQDGPHLAPVSGRARIDVLDILRGIAILGIFYMNIPYMGNSGTLQETDIRRIGWTLADRTNWAFIEIFWEGTQRGLLEFLFGAGAMVLTAKAMKPDGPVAVADVFYRRNLWLFAFGLLDIFLLTWIGDILHIYALAALVIFPFRLLRARWLVCLGLLFAAFVAHGGLMEYQSRTGMVHNVQAARGKEQAKKPLSKEEKEAKEQWQKKLDRLNLANPIDKDTQKLAVEEAAARRAGPAVYMPWAWGTWNLIFIGKNGTFFGVLESICGMFLGMAFWKLGIIQGRRSRRFYGLLALVAYAVGLGARAVGVCEIFTFQPIPKTIWMTNELARLAVSLGHLALVNLLVQTKLGHGLLSPLKAAGRTAFSLYFLTSIIGIWFIFAPWGLNLWGHYSWAGLNIIATMVVLVLLAVSNVWMRHFTNGPLEWLWRSLVYWERQPFRRRA